MCDSPLQSTAFKDLPVPAYERSENGFFGINHDTIIYTSRIKRLHSASSNGTEWLLKLCKLNVKTDDFTTAIVDDFGSMQKQMIIDHNSSSKKNIERKNFVGNLYCHQGHENWWILSFKSTNKGQDDVALFFNYVSNESFKITKKIDLSKPQLLFIRALWGDM